MDFVSYAVVVSLSNKEIFPFLAWSTTRRIVSDELYPVTVAGRKSQSLSILTDIKVKYDRMVMRRDSYQVLVV